MDTAILEQIIPVASSMPVFLAVILVMAIAFFGAFIGGMTGLGGGMLIKPILGNALAMATSTLSLYASKFISTSVVFSMSAKSALIYKKEGFEYNMTLFAYMGIGLALGIFSVDFLPFDVSGGMEVFLQGCLYVLVFFSVLFRDKYPRLNFIDNKVMMILVGFVIGFLSSFFGIGGGAIKVPFFLIFFAMDMKQAAVYSFLVSLVTEPLKLFQYGSHIYSMPDVTGALPMIILLSVLCIPSAIFGAILGVGIQKKSSEKFVATAFNTVIIYFAIISLISGVSMLNGNGPISLFNLFM